MTAAGLAPALGLEEMGTPDCHRTYIMCHIVSLTVQVVTQVVFMYEQF